MERVRNAFIGLLRSGLWGHDPIEEGFLQLTDDQWEEVYSMSKRQTVTGILFDGICRLPDESQPPAMTLAKWVATVDRIERDNKRMNIALRDLVRLFVNNGLRPVLQKGQSLATLYPVPWHRECGDIDLYFSGLVETTGMAENDKAIELVKGHGTKVELMPDRSQSYEWHGIEIEHHPTIVDLSGPCLRKRLRTFGEDHGVIPSNLVDGLLVPSSELNAVLLNSHILKHTLGKGIGLRQICDLAMAYHRMSAEDGKKERGERIYSLYREAWLLKWSRLLHSFLVDIIGLPEEELPYPEKIVSPVPLIRIVEEGGNFGRYRNGIRDRNRSKRKLNTALMFFKRAGFSIRFAPNEAFWTVARLAMGQFKK